MKILRIPQVCQMLTISRSTLYNWITPSSPFYLADFPKRVRLTPGTTGWLEDEIIDFVQRKKMVAHGFNSHEFRPAA